MFTRWLPVLLIACLATGARGECGCLWQGAFADVQQDTDLVIAGSVISSSGNSIDVQVDRTLRGELYRETVRIWLDTGDLCRAEVSNFAPDSTWVMALDRINEIPQGGFNPRTPNISYGRIGDYSLSRCGGYWLKRSDNMVSGNLISGPRWEMDPKMSPILLDLVAGYVSGDIDRKTLEEAGKVDPALQELIINTRLFLRQSQGQ